MSERSFRERFGALQQDAVRPQRAMHDEWPLPADARLLSTAAGPCAVIERVVGGQPIAAAHERFLAAAAANDGRYHDPRRLIFLDTETTGLSGGTGTYVFLVGIGQFVGRDFLLRQFFMRHPGDERSLLAGLTEAMTGAGGLVTYNGRTFDVPLLDTRFRMHSQPFPSLDAHFDLLSPARAIWKHRLPNCSLSTIERMVLGVSRGLDAPGWMIPQMYFDYLQSRDVASLNAVFEHNRTDIVTLARLMSVVQSYEAGLDQPTDAVDRVAVALHRWRVFGSPEALEALSECWNTLSVPTALRLRVLREVTIAYKRQRKYATACAIWEQALSDPSRDIRLLAAEELSKYLEHRERDHERALAIAQRGADGAALAGDLEMVAAFEHRLRRLEMKLNRTQPGHVVGEGMLDPE